MRWEVENDIKKRQRWNDIKKLTGKGISPSPILIVFNKTTF